MTNYNFGGDDGKSQLKELKMNKVRHFREMRCLRQVDLARMAKISISWLWTLENGLEDRVSRDLKERISAALECDYKDIFPAE